MAVKRLGFMTGKVYDEDADVSKIQECCIRIPDNVFNDQHHLDIFSHFQHSKCLRCPDQAACAVRNNCVNIDAHLLQVL